LFRPSRGFLPLMATCFSAVGVYYLLGVRLRLPDAVSMTSAIAAALVLSLLFARLRSRRDQ
jgi:hypothetical protein